MKILILPIFLLAFVSLFAQKYQCTYNAFYTFYYSKDTVNNSEYSKPDRFILYGNEKESSFKGWAFYILDSLRYNFNPDLSYNATPEELPKLMDKFFALKPPRHGFDVKCHKTFKDKNLWFLFSSIDGAMACQSKMDYVWHHHQERDTFQGIEVQMAQTQMGGRTWIAWYAPSIPVNDGPYKFSGLPGLIVKVYDDQKRYFFEMEKIEPPQERLFTINDSKSRTRVSTCEEVKSYMHNFKENPRVSFLLSSKAEMLQKVKEGNKTRFDLLIEQ